MDRTQWFGGVETLIRSKFRLMALCAIFALGVALFLGFVFKLDSMSMTRVDDIVTGWCITSIILAPFIMGAYTTISSVQGRFGSRRLELLTLPLGRLAIPTSLAVNSFLTTLIFWVAGFIGFGLAADPLALSFNFLFDHGKHAAEIFNAYAIAAFLFTYAFCIVATGAHTATFSALWIIAPSVVLLLSQGMGYTWNDVEFYLGVMLTIGTVYYGSLPFILYSRPRFHWTVGASKWGKHMFDVALQISSLGAIVSFAIFEVGSTFIFFTLVSVLIVSYLYVKRDPNARNAMGHARVGNIIALSILMTLTLIGIYIDNRLVNSASPEHNMSIQRIQPSPSNDFLLVSGGPEVVDYRRHSFNPSIRRAYLFDLKGQTAPIEFPFRNVFIGADCWSKDSRFVAVHSAALGRINGFAFDGNVAGASSSELAMRYLGRYWNPTAIYDTVEKKMNFHERPPLLADGWEHPDDLVHMNFSITGEIEIYSVNQGRAILTNPHTFHFVNVYKDGLAHFRLANSPEVYVFRDNKLEKVPNKRWEGDSMIDTINVEKALENPYRWSRETVYDDHDASKDLRMTFTNGDRVRSFKVKRDWVRYHSEGVYLISEKGLISVNLLMNKETVLFKCQPDEKISVDDSYYSAYLLNFSVKDTRYGTLNLISGEFHSINDPKIIGFPFYVLGQDTVLYMSVDQSWNLGQGTKHRKLYEIGRPKGS